MPCSTAALPCQHQLLLLALPRSGKRLSERQRQGGCRGLLVALFTLVCAPAKLLGPSECTAAQQKQLAAGKGLRAFQRCIYLDTSGEEGWGGRGAGAAGGWVHGEPVLSVLGIVVPLHAHVCDARAAALSSIPPVQALWLSWR